MTERLLLATTNGAVTILTLNRPAVRNALNRGMLAELDAALLRAAADPAVGALVLTGAGPGFCSGLDRDDFLGADADRSVVNDTISAVARFEKPLVAAVNGPAVTAGLELALACDFIVVGEQGWFADTHVRLGLFAGAGLYTRLADAVGARRAKELSLSGQRVSATQACEIGLANLQVATADLLPHCVEVAASMSGCPEVAVAVKHCYDASAHRITAGLFDERQDWRRWQDRQQIT